MELKDFIEQSVSDIVEATKTIKTKYNVGHFTMHPIANSSICDAYYKPHEIEFDIAVTTSENGTAKAGSKIGISVLGANINGEKGFTNENCSRIRFSIPFYPEYINNKGHNHD